MSLISFKDWYAQHKESSAYTRARMQGELGLGPDVSHTGHSRSTFNYKKRKKKKKSSKKK